MDKEVKPAAGTGFDEGGSAEAVVEMRNWLAERARNVYRDGL